MKGDTSPSGVTAERNDHSMSSAANCLINIREDIPIIVTVAHILLLYEYIYGIYSIQ